MSKVLKNFVGIDISKPFFDVALLRPHLSEEVVHRRFKQSADGLADFEQWLTGQQVLLDEQTLVCMEYTGMYNAALLDLLSARAAQVLVEMALKIKRTEGFRRSSDDKTDAIKIAWYAFRYQQHKKLWSPADSDLERIRHLIAQRDRIVESLSRLTVPLKELEAIGCLQQARAMEKLQHKAVRQLEKAKADIEADILKIVGASEVLSNKMKRATSVKGVGKITAITFLAYTKAFSSFAHAKQLACYCGVVPFMAKQSGISVRSKARVSAFANKKLKRLLHLCALSAIRCDQQIKAYWERKKAEGKNAMSIINAIRNKLVLRIFAVIRDDRDFVENYVRTGE